MEQSISLITVVPVNENYFEYSVNTLERRKWIQRDELRFFLANNIPRDIMSIKVIKELVDTYQSFVVDVANKEYYTMEFQAEKKNITNIVSERHSNKDRSEIKTILDLSGDSLSEDKSESILDKISRRVSTYKLNIK